MNAFVSENITSDDKVVTLYSLVVWSVGLRAQGQGGHCWLPRAWQEDLGKEGVLLYWHFNVCQRHHGHLPKPITDWATAMQSSLLGSPIASHGRGNHWTLRSTCHSPLSTWRVFSRSCGINLSVSNVKTLIHNADMIQRFIRMSGKRPHRLLNTNDFKELLFYGVSDAAWLVKFQRTIGGK